ncbi:MAG: hypothetical protein JNL64_01110 [Blastocatellia bacterium]|jgi:peptidoglycan/LPS O-acetylase OafA/YrhL|nr:hypothetical protein [Blastocatellia bacterium]
MKLENKRLVGILVAVAFMLLIPFTAMKLGVEGVKWDWFDFTIAGALLLGAGLACELFLRILRTPVQRLAACAIVLAVLAVVWAELAVGIIGTPFAGS